MQSPAGKLHQNLEREVTLNLIKNSGSAPSDGMALQIVIIVKIDIRPQATQILFLLDIDIQMEC